MPEPKGIGKLVGEVVPGVSRVTMYDDRIDFESDSYVVVEKDRAILIDPLPMNKRDLKKLGAVEAICLTASCHERAAWRYQDSFKVPVYAPRRGVDYYNTKTGAIESGGTDKIAVWLLDPDCHGRSLYPRQVFFPMAGEGEGWARLAKNLKAEIDEGLIEAYRGTVSLPFDAGQYKRVAVKIVDDRGIESLKIVGIPS